MKSLGILGTSSNAGKTWVTTAFCAWLRREGVRVAPFKAQNMSNNAGALVAGGEMARAQIVQAEAAGITPEVAMNPILLKPSGAQGAQVVVMGQAEDHQSGRGYYESFDRHWQTVADVLDGWRERCDVLVMEGAGSPVELNLMERDLVNLRPIRHLDGRWVLVGDIDRGGIYAQLAGTWALLSEADRARGLGAIVNRFRGDISLFPDPTDWLAPHAPGFDVLGTLPYRPDLQPEEEDGLREEDADRGTGETIAWVRLPHAANLTDCQPWWDDEGVRTRWTVDPAVITTARAIVLPGSKNTLADLRWLRETGLADVIVAAARAGRLVIGICGGYQLLGQRLIDTSGVAGEAGDEAGLGLLPHATEFHAQKLVRPVQAGCDGEKWQAYEIHMGRNTVPLDLTPAEPLHEVTDQDGAVRPEGSRQGLVWGTYLHGWFESPAVRRRVAQEAGIAGHEAASELWSERRQKIYAAMADHLVAHVDLDPVRRYLEI
jgi:adenosylcobyric acid synthase